MSLFHYDDHQQNAPETWLVVKVAPNVWRLTTKGGVTLEQTTTRKAALALKENGSHLVNLWYKELRWYQGFPVHGWKDFGPEVIEAQRRARLTA